MRCRCKSTRISCPLFFACQRYLLYFNEQTVAAYNLLYEVQCSHIEILCFNQDWTWGIFAFLAGKRHILIVKIRYTGYCLNQRTNIGFFYTVFERDAFISCKTTLFLQMLYLRSSYGNKQNFIRFYMVLFSLMRYMFYYRPTSILIYHPSTYISKMPCCQNEVPRPH